MINSSKQENTTKQPLFVNYVYFFAALLVLINNSLVTDKTILSSFLALFHHSAEPSFMDAFVLIGNIFIVPLLIFLFGLNTYHSIQHSSPIKFLKHRLATLVPLFLVSALLIMPLSYYLLDTNNGAHNSLWHYLTHSYFTQWLVGPAWIFSMIIGFDIIIFLVFEFCHPLVHNLFSLVKNAKVYRLLLVFFLLSFVIFFLTNDFWGKVMFLDITQHNSTWTHVGPIWWQKNVMITYFVIYVFSVLLGGSTDFLNYIFTSREQLSTKWLHRLLETVILYSLIKLVEPKESILDSHLAVKIILSFLSILLLFTVFSFFFSLLSRFAYRKSKLLSALSKYSLMIYTLHFLPLVFIKNYSETFHIMTNIQKTYVIFIFTFFASLLLSYCVEKLWLLGKRIY